MWSACLGFVPCHEANVLRECDVGHLLLQQAAGWSNLQSLLPSHPQSRFECKVAEALLCILCADLSAPAGCGGSISSWNGSIASPYYTSYYPPNIDCTWIIQVSHRTACTIFVHIPSRVFSRIWLLYQAPLPGYLISMTIVKMDIQDSPSSDGCEKDWLDIGGVK